jgi:hypothetical protein
VGATTGRVDILIQNKKSTSKKKFTKRISAKPVQVSNQKRPQYE